MTIQFQLHPKKDTLRETCNNKIKSENSVTLLGITIDSRLSFDNHISKLCGKTLMQLNAIFRLKTYMN